MKKLTNYTALEIAEPLLFFAAFFVAHIFLGIVWAWMFEL